MANEAKKEDEQHELIQQRKPLRCLKCGRRIMDASSTAKMQFIIPKKGRYPELYVKCRHCGAELGVVKTE